MKQSTLCFCLRGSEVLLAMKKRGFGAGFWNGYGGKVEANESITVAAVRELKEESGLEAREDTLELVARVRFFFADTPISECSVFLIRSWQGEPVETEEMSPRWFAVDHLPWESMWPGDDQWIPQILSGEKLDADLIFNADGSKMERITRRPLA